MPSYALAPFLTELHVWSANVINKEAIVTERADQPSD
jgi:hypothetical protein